MVRYLVQNREKYLYAKYMAYTVLYTPYISCTDPFVILDRYGIFVMA